MGTYLDCGCYIGENGRTMCPSCSSPTPKKRCAECNSLRTALAEKEGEIERLKEYVKTAEDEEKDWIHHYMELYEKYEPLSAENQRIRRVVEAADTYVDDHSMDNYNALVEALSELDAGQGKTEQGGSDA